MNNKSNRYKKIMIIYMLVCFSFFMFIKNIYVKANVIPGIKYNTYIQNKGWQDNYTLNGKTSGITSENLMIQSIRIKLVNEEDLGVNYSVKTNDKNWIYSCNNEVCGTTNKSSYIETIRINLTGKNANKYNIFYRTYVSKLGWLSWASNGKEAGSIGLGYGVKGIQIKILPKTSSGPADTVMPCKYNLCKVNYKTSTTNSGWGNWYSNGKESNRIGKTVAINGFKLNVSDKRYEGGVVYKSYIQNKGWQDNVSNREVSGDVGTNEKLQAIKINLTGNLSNYYDIYYRVYTEKLGWQDWAKNGEACGTSGYNYSVKSMQIKVIEKCAQSPLNTVNHYKSKNNDLDSQNDLVYLKWNDKEKELSIYRKATEEKSWIRHVFKHITCNSLSKNKKIIKYNNKLASCFDLWQIKGAFICTRNEDGTFTDSIKDPIIHLDAEWEMAIREVVNGEETSDFVGGKLHGNEMLKNITFFADGKEYEPNELDGVSCKVFKVVEKTNVYRDNTLEFGKNSVVATDTPFDPYGFKIATHDITYKITRDSVVISQDLNWNIDTICNYSCMAMLGAKRVINNGQCQVTDTGIRQNDNNTYDCSKAKVKEGIYISIPNCKKAYLWNSGKNGGLNCEFSAEVLEETEMPGKNFKVSNSNLYNKFYFGYCANGQKVSSGDNWHCKAKYTIDYKGKF